MRSSPSLVLSFHVGGDTWTVDTRGRGSVYQGPVKGAAAADATVEMDGVNDLLALLERRIGFASALLQRRLRVSGDLSMLSTCEWLLPMSGSHRSFMRGVLARLRRTLVSPFKALDTLSSRAHSLLRRVDVKRLGVRILAFAHPKRRLPRS